LCAEKITQQLRNKRLAFYANRFSQCAGRRLFRSTSRRLEVLGESEVRPELRLTGACSQIDARRD
jgi:hypothetical protein